jgi:hypothetical protein
VETTVTFAEPAIPAVETAAEPELEEHHEMHAPAEPRFAELSEEPDPGRQPRDYAADVLEPVSGGSGLQEQAVDPVTTLFTEGTEAEHRDLDVPAFLRRLRF